MANNNLSLTLNLKHSGDENEAIDCARILKRVRSEAKPSQLPRPMGPYLEVFQSEHGRGVRTTQDDIRAGTVLYFETTALWGLPRTDRDRRGPQLQMPIHKAVTTSLTQHDQVKFRALTHPDGDDTIAGRFDRNAVRHFIFPDVRSAIAARHGVQEASISYFTHSLWLDMAMVNHSCRPNARLVCQGDDKRNAFIVAQIDIPSKGTEITRDYTRFRDNPAWMNRELLRDERQRELSILDGFHCTCPACGHSVEESSDERLKTINNLAAKLGFLRKPHRQVPSTRVLDEHLHEYLRCLEKEQLITRLYEAHSMALAGYQEAWSVCPDESLKAKIQYHGCKAAEYSRIAEVFTAPFKGIDGFSDGRRVESEMEES